MNRPFMAYKTNEEKMVDLKKIKNKSIINKSVYTFFGFCLIWFGYTIIKILTV